MTPNVPNDCPIFDARTRILERRQTEDDYGRNFYLVEVTYSGGQEPSSTWLQSSDNSDKTGTEVETVDASRILQYVSPRELERFENEQFRIEAEAQAIADKVEEEEQVRRRIARNARLAAGKGSGMLDTIGIDPDLRTAGAVKGRPRGRGRGRGRGRPRGSWRGRVAIPFGGMRIKELAQDRIIDSEPGQTQMESLPIAQGEIMETSSEPEDDMLKKTSPGLMRSAFVTNSALPLSPVRPHRPAIALQRGQPKVPDISDTDTPVEDSDSMSSAAMQLQVEEDQGVFDDTASESDSPDLHRNKRRRTESVEPQHTLMFQPSSQIEVSESEDESIPADPPSANKATKYKDASQNPNAAPHNNHLSLPRSPSPEDRQFSDSESEDGEQDEDENADAEEYVVEAITEHYHDDDGRRFYLVKWQGYKDSYDWLPEEDLGGATELVRGYNDSVRRKKGKARAM